MNDAHSIKPSEPWRTTSLREQPESTIRAAIHSPNDPGATLMRANTVLSLYFDPDTTPEMRAAMREEFVRALASYPDWAVQRAFDAWVKRHNRRPSPGEIAILAQAEISEMFTELKRREPAKPTDRMDACTPEAAKRILTEAGFTPRYMQAVAKSPMAGSRDEVLSSFNARPHWTDAIPAGMEHDADAIRAARQAAANSAQNADASQ